MPTAPIRIYLATGNSHKVEEIDSLLRDLSAPCTVLGARSIGGMPAVDENADSFEGNARLKASALMQQLQTAQQRPTASDGNSERSDTQDGKPDGNSERGGAQDDKPDGTQDGTRGGQTIYYVLADDSGLSVDALGGAPGIHSARYAGDSANDHTNNALLLQNLANVPEGKRYAAFVCCFYLLGTDGTEAVFHGRCEGHIAFRPEGGDGFGYDPLFIPEGYDQSLAELGGAIKNTLSHRTRCCQQLAAFLKQIR